MCSISCYNLKKLLWKASKLVPREINKAMTPVAEKKTTFKFEKSWRAICICYFKESNKTDIPVSVSLKCYQMAFGLPKSFLKYALARNLPSPKKHFKFHDSKSTFQVAEIKIRQELWRLDIANHIIFIIQVISFKKYLKLRKRVHI